MTTSWKKICSKLKTSGMIGKSQSRGRFGSDDSVTSNTNSDIDFTTNSSTPLFNSQARNSFDNEWQMNYMIINRRDGLTTPRVRKDKREEKKSATAFKEAKPKVGSRIDTGINVVKLKLLDATRKAIIEKQKKQLQLTSSSTQTDAFKTKLCKDQSVENQQDLIQRVDETTETDVELVAIKAADGTLVITTTFGVNTDKIATDTVATQTVMPRSNVSFKRLNESRHTIRYDDEVSNEDDSDDPTLELINIEKRMRARKKLHRQRSSIKNIDIVIEDEASDVIAIETIPAEVPKKVKKDSDSEFEDSIDLQPDVIKASVPKNRPKNADSTFNSWHDLDFPEEKVELPKSCFTDYGPTPWSNFKELVLGQRFLNARLSPIPQRHSRPNMKQVTWSDSQVKVVSDLINEANSLLEMFDQVAMLLGPDIKLHNVSDVEDFILPPSKYSDEMTKSCEKLEASLKRLQDIKAPDEQKI